MDEGTRSVTLDDDVLEELRELAALSGQRIEALVNAVLRDYLRHETAVASSGERGLSDSEAGRSSTSDDLLEIVKRAREALASDHGISHEESIARARSAVERTRSKNA